MDADAIIKTMHKISKHMPANPALSNNANINLAFMVFMAVDLVFNFISDSPYCFN